MSRESQIAILLRIELLLKDLFEVLHGAPLVSSKRDPTGKKSTSDFFSEGVFPWKGNQNGKAKCGLCSKVVAKPSSMLGPNGHLWLRHRREMKKAGIKY
jgi:hypothetical protein